MLSDGLYPRCNATCFSLKKCCISSSSFLSFFLCFFLSPFLFFFQICQQSKRKFLVLHIPALLRNPSRKCSRGSNPPYRDARDVKSDQIGLLLVVCKTAELLPCELSLCLVHKQVRNVRRRSTSGAVALLLSLGVKLDPSCQ